MPEKATLQRSDVAPPPDAPRWGLRAVVLTGSLLDPWQLFLTLTLLCLCAAGLSLLQQFDGLYGAAGLTPLAPHAAKLGFSATALPTLEALGRAPSLLPLLAPLLGLSLEDSGRLLALLCFAGGLGGALCAFAPSSAASAPARHAAVALCWASYLSLLTALPPPFTNFQWDQLLVEVAFAAVLAGPVGVCAPPPPLVLLVLRFAAFKLMLMSGAVKLQAGCPTWDSLTATEVHFASQPLPAPTSAALHSLPPLLHALSVAATLWIELPGALLLLLPATAPWAVAAQVLLQGLIVASGNYNFFNVLTAAMFLPILLTAPPHTRPLLSTPFLRTLLFLALAAASACAMFQVHLLPATLSVPPSPAAARAAAEGWGAGSGSEGEGTALVTPWWLRLQVALQPQWRSTGAALGPALDWIIRCACVWALGLFVWEAARCVLEQVQASALELMGEGKGEREESLRLRAAAAAEEEEEERQRELEQCGPEGCAVRPQGMYVRAADTLSWGLYHAALTPGRVLRVVLGWGVTAAFLCATGATLTSSAVNLALLRRSTLIDPAVRKGYTSFTTAKGWEAALHSVRVDWGLPPQALAVHGAVHALRLSSGYGLFRSMTGQGPQGVVDAWGQGVQTTLRPELIVEGWWPASCASVPGVWVAPAAAQEAEPAAGEGGFWREIPFPYKPGPTHAPPVWVAPHSPRLDWQLWFAALGSRAQDAYVHHLASLILHGSPAVYSLLLPTSATPAGSAQPAALGWPVAFLHPRSQARHAVPPKRLRIRRFAYDFVRRPANASWVRHRHQPLSAFFGLPEGEEGGGEEGGSAVWQRAPVEEEGEGGGWQDAGEGAEDAGEGAGEGGSAPLYLPEVSPFSKSLRDAVSAAGWSSAKHAIPQGPPPSSAAWSEAWTSARASYATLLEEFRLVKRGSGEEDMLSWLYHALNLQALYQRPLAALLSQKPGNPVLRLAKVAALGIVPCLAYTARLALSAARWCGVEQTPGYAEPHAELTRLVFVPGSAHTSTAWPLVGGLFLLFGAVTAAAVMCCRCRDD